MNRRTNLNISEKIPCDIIAGAGNSIHSPIASPAPEEKIISS